MQSFQGLEVGWGEVGGSDKGSLPTRLIRGFRGVCRSAGETHNGHRSRRRPRDTHEKILEEVPSLKRRRHDAVVTTGLARQGGALPTEGRPSLSLLTGKPSLSVLSTLSPRLSAPREAELKEH